MNRTRVVSRMRKGPLGLAITVVILFAATLYDRSYTISDNLLIARKWIASFRRSEWKLADYPVRTRANAGDSTADRACVAQILNWPGPSGIGPTKEQALARLEENLESIRKNRQSMPRPGTEVPIEFASSTRVDSDLRLRDDFITNVLRRTPDSLLFISDESSLYDFGNKEEVAEFQKKILKLYQVDVSDLNDAHISDILERIKKSKKAGE